MPQCSAGLVRNELAERLRARVEKIEEVVYTRVTEIGNLNEVTDPAYRDGLRGAVSAALDYGLTGLTSSDELPPPVPVELIAQARLASRNQIGLNVVLRRYFAGYTVLGDFLVQEAGQMNLSSSTLEHLLRTQALLFDRLVNTVNEEYAHEEQPLLGSGERYRLQIVRRQLAGEPVEVDELGYRFGTTHVGLIAIGPGAKAVTHELAGELDRSLLVARPDGDTVWAWLGGDSPIDMSALCEVILTRRTDLGTIAIGEPEEGIAGWRLTHRQAAAALRVAQRREPPFARYLNVALLASALGDDLLIASLKRHYLEPLESRRDGGKVARETLHAFFRAGRNISSTAASLRVSRNTVASRLSRIEADIGCPLGSCAAEFALAVELERLGVA